MRMENPIYTGRTKKAWKSRKDTAFFGKRDTIRQSFYVRKAKSQSMLAVLFGIE